MLIAFRFASSRTATSSSKTRAPTYTPNQMTFRKVSSGLAHTTSLIVLLKWLVSTGRKFSPPVLPNICIRFQAC